MAELDPRRWKALAVVCAAFFMTVLDVSIVNVALPSIGRVAPLLAGQPPVGDHRLRDHVRRLPAARRPRGRPARPAPRLPRRRRRLHDRVVPLRPRVVRRRPDRRARGAGPRRRDHLAGRALDHHDDLRGRPRAEQGARHLGRDRRLGRRGRRARRRRPDEVPRLGVDLLRQRARSASLAFLLAPRFVRESRSDASSSPDVAGAVTVTAGLALLVYAVSKAPDHGWGSGWTISRIAAAVVLLGVVPRDRVARAGPADAVLASSGCARSRARTSPACCSERSSSRTSSCSPCTCSKSSAGRRSRPGSRSSRRPGRAVALGGRRAGARDDASARSR